MDENKKPKPQTGDSKIGRPPSNARQVLGSIYRNLDSFRAYAAQTGNYTIKHRGLSFNLIDLEEAPKKLLAPAQAKAFHLLCIMDMHPDQAGPILGISPKTAHLNAYDALNKLVKHYFADEKYTPSEPPPIHWKHRGNADE